MWKQLFDWFTQALRQTEETQRNRAEIKELRQQVDQLTDKMQHLIYNMHRLEAHERHEREKLEAHERHEREKLELRLQLEQLRNERGLPPAEEKSMAEPEAKAGKARSPEDES